MRGDDVVRMAENRPAFGAEQLVDLLRLFFVEHSLSVGRVRDQDHRGAGKDQPGEVELPGRYIIAYAGLFGVGERQFHRVRIDIEAPGLDASSR